MHQLSKLLGEDLHEFLPSESSGPFLELRELLWPEKVVGAHLTSKTFTVQWYSDGKEMYQNACCTCRAVLLIKSNSL